MTSKSQASKRPGRFFVISAASGTGKTTLIKRLLQEIPQLSLSVSYTTRSKRPGEQEGFDYHYISPEAFDEMVSRGEFFEWEEVHGARYGTPNKPLIENRQHGIDTLFDVDTRGAFSIRKHYPDSPLIFILPPSLEALLARLNRRHTDDPALVQRRFAEGQRQIVYRDKFDYNVVNDDVERAFAELKGIILTSRK